MTMQCQALMTYRLNVHLRRHAYMRSKLVTLRYSSIAVKINRCRKTTKQQQPNLRNQRHKDTVPSSVLSWIKYVRSSDEKTSILSSRVASSIRFRRLSYNVGSKKAKSCQLICNKKHYVIC